MRRRVVITGLGPVTAYGIGMDPLWNAMIEGRTAIAPVTSIDASAFRCQVAAMLEPDALAIRKLVPKSYRKNTKVMCRDIELAVAAAGAAVADARLVTKGTDADAEPTIAPARVGCHIGAGLIAADVNELTAALVTSQSEDGSFDMQHWGGPGMENLTPLWLLKYLPNMLACHVTIVHDCQGPSNTITCCEASSALSIGESMRVIERGMADACLSGGADYKMNPLAYMRQEFAGRVANATPEADPSRAARPFASDADGSVIGEGGGLLVVESDETARARGATIYAEIAGFAATQSFRPGASGLEIEEDGSSIADAMEIAISAAGIRADAIDAVVPLGSGIPDVDAAERAALERVFGTRAAEVPLITTVPFAGNCCAGNSAVAVSVACRALQEQKLPARLGANETPGLNAARTPSRAATLRHILLITTSQGGQNAALVLRQP